MNLNEMCYRYLRASNPSRELKEAIFKRVVRLLRVAVRAPRDQTTASAWDDPRLSPFEDVPYLLFDRLDRFRREEREVLPATPHRLLVQAMMDSARKWSRQRRGEVLLPSLEGIDRLELPDTVTQLLDSAFGDLEQRQLVERFLSDIADFINSWDRPQDRLIAYFGLPHVHSDIARLLITYHIRTTQELAADIERPEVDVLTLLAMRDKFGERLAEVLAIPPKRVENRSGRLVAALRAFARSLPYVVELCRAIHTD